MPDVSKITINDTTYDVKDAIARNTVGVGYGSSTTGANQRDKVVSVSGYFETNAGYILAVQSTNGNTYTGGSVRLNVNGIGAKAVYAHGNITSTTNTLPWPANSLIYFMSDGSHWVYMGMDTDAATPIPTDLKKQMVVNTVDGVGNLEYLLGLKDSTGDIGNGTRIGIASGDNITLEFDSSNHIKINAVTQEMPFFQAVRTSGTVSLSASTITTIPLTSSNSSVVKSDNADDYFEFASNGIKCKQAGTIEVNGGCYFTAGTSSYSMGVYFKKGSTEIGSGAYQTGGGNARSLNGIVIDVAADDIITLCGRSSAANTVSNNKSTYLSIKYLDKGGSGGSGSGGGGSIASTTSVLKGDGNGGAVAATAGTDYMAPVTLATVATSGSYADLSNKPTIPSAGLPAGGSSGQVLAKTSGADYAVGWVNQSGGGGGSWVDISDQFSGNVMDGFTAYTNGSVAVISVSNSEFDGCTIDNPAYYTRDNLIFMGAGVDETYEPAMLYAEVGTIAPWIYSSSSGTYMIFGTLVYLIAGA